METSWWVLAATAALPAAAVWCVDRWRHGRQRAALMAHLDKTERARQFAVQQALQARKQVEKLQKELSEHRRAASQSTAQREKTRQLQAAPDAAPEPAVVPEDTAAPAPPTHGFADTLPM
jgi:hypothetical protein